MLKAPFHPIKGRNRYCGPAAMATILRDHRSRRVLRGLTGNAGLRESLQQHLTAAMEQLGVRDTPACPDAAYVELGRLPRVQSAVFQPPISILQFGVHGDSHYGTISGVYQCNLSRMPVPFESIPSTGLRQA